MAKPKKLNLKKLVLDTINNNTSVTTDRTDVSGYIPFQQKSPDTFVLRDSFFYTHGRTASGLADKIKKAMGHTGLECTILDMAEIRQTWPKQSFFQVVFKVQPTQELEDMMSENPGWNPTLPPPPPTPPRQRLRPERQLVNPGTAPSRGHKPNNRLGWSKDQFNSFLEHTKPGSLFRNLVKDLSSGKIHTLMYWPGSANNFKRWFTVDHSYPGVVRLIELVNKAIESGDSSKVQSLAQQLEKRIEVIWDAARTERRLKSMKSVKSESPILDEFVKVAKLAVSIRREIRDATKDTYKHSASQLLIALENARNNIGWPKIGLENRYEQARLITKEMRQSKTIHDYMNALNDFIYMIGSIISGLRHYNNDKRKVQE